MPASPSFSATRIVGLGPDMTASNAEGTSSVHATATRTNAISHAMDAS